MCSRLALADSSKLRKLHIPPPRFGMSSGVGTGEWHILIYIMIRFRRHDCRGLQELGTWLISISDEATRKSAEAEGIGIDSRSGRTKSRIASWLALGDGDFGV